MRPARGAAPGAGWNGRSGAGAAAVGSGSKKVVGEWQLERRLGSGSFASVFLARHVRHEEKLVAIKAISRSKLNRKLEKNLQKEVLILQGLSHENIVQLFDCHESARHIYLVLEYCAGGDLHVLLRKRGALEPRLARGLMQQLGAGMKYLWDRSLIHRDLKPQNLLLSDQTEEAKLKIADFGFATHLAEATMADTMCGSPLYMAPEILAGKRYDSKADLWSAGTILFEMLTGRPPFSGGSPPELLRNITRARFKFPRAKHQDVSEECASFLESLLCANPIDRITFEGFCTHPYLAVKLVDRHTAPGGKASSTTGLGESALSAPASAASSQSSLPDSCDSSNSSVFGGGSAMLFRDGDAQGEAKAPPSLRYSQLGSNYDSGHETTGSSTARRPHSRSADHGTSGKPEPYRHSPHAAQLEPSASAAGSREDAWELIEGELEASSPAVSPASSPGRQTLAAPQPQSPRSPRFLRQWSSSAVTKTEPTPGDGAGPSQQQSGQAQSVRFAGELCERAAVLARVASCLTAPSGEGDSMVEAIKPRDEPAVCALTLLVRVLEILEVAQMACDGLEQLSNAALLRAARVVRDESRGLFQECVQRCKALEAAASATYAPETQSHSAERLMLDISLELGAAAASRERLALEGRSPTLMTSARYLIDAAISLVDLLCASTSFGPRAGSRDIMLGLRAAFGQRQRAIKSAHASLRDVPAAASAPPTALESC